MDTTVGAMSMQWGSRRKWGDVHAAKVGVEPHAVVGEGERDEGCPGLGGFPLYSGLQVMVGFRVGGGVRRWLAILWCTWGRLVEERQTELSSAIARCW